MAVLWEIDPTSEDSVNVPLALTTAPLRLLADGGMDLTPPDIDAIYAPSADTEGDPYVSSRHRNRTITLNLLAKDSTDALTQTAIYGVQQKVDKLRREGGTLKYTTMAGTEIVFDVIKAAFKPQFTQEHYALNKAVPFSLEFECKPYGRGTPVLLSDHAETTSPCLIFTESSLAGDVLGRGKLVIDEDQGTDQAWLVWGLRSRYYDSAASAALFYEAEGRTAMGGSSVVTGPSGASGGASNNVMRNTALTTSYQAILSTQATGGGAHLSHVGTYRVYARMQMPITNTGTLSIALTWAAGDFRTFTTNAATSFANSVYASLGVGTWRLVDLGLVSIPKVAQGTQRWEGRIIAKSTVAGDDVDIDYLLLVPVDEGSGIVSSRSRFDVPSSFSARDEFDQTSGNLTGKTLPIGGTWAGAGDSDDFVVDTAAHTALRIASGDTGTLAGSRFAIAGTATFTNVLAQVSTWPVSLSEGHDYGIVARYTDTNNCAFVFVTNAPVTSSIFIASRVAGVDTIHQTLTYSGYQQAAGEVKSLRLKIDDAGRIFAWWWTPAGTGLPSEPLLSGYSPDLATGGTLATGKVGFFDRHTGAGAPSRQYDDFFVAVPPKDAAVFASQSLEVRHNAVIREDSGGTIWTPPSSYEGDYLLIPPAGKEGRTSQIVIKGSRNDPAMLPDAGIDDISARLTYTPRYLVLPS